VAATTAPTINFTIGKEVIDMLRGNMPDIANPGVQVPTPPYQEPVPAIAMPIAPAAVPRYEPVPPIVMPIQVAPAAVPRLVLKGPVRSRSFCLFWKDR
jgi:hypothetical protein